MPRGRSAPDWRGEVFNRWTVIQREPNSPSGQLRWLCRCECGNEAVVQGGALKSGHSQSCGCHKRDATIRRSTKHGHATGGISKTYHTWAGMKARCDAPNHHSYANYGGRGITYAARWRWFHQFLEDMGRKPPGKTLERKDPNGPYNKENCVWATPREQGNNKRNNRLITIDGETKTAAEWRRAGGISRGTFEDRLSNGWNPKEAVFTPAGTSNNNAKSRMLTHEGKTMCVSDWARHLGVRSDTISQRLFRGEPICRALHPGRLEKER